MSAQKGDLDYLLEAALKQWGDDDDFVDAIYSAIAQRNQDREKAAHPADNTPKGGVEVICGACGRPKPIGGSTHCSLDHSIEEAVEHAPPG